MCACVCVFVCLHLGQIWSLCIKSILPHAAANADNHREPCRRRPAARPGVMRTSPPVMWNYTQVKLRRYQTELAPPSTHEASLYPSSVKTRLRRPSLDHCTHAHTHMHKHAQLLTAAGSLIIAITAVTALPHLMISVL